MRLSFLVVFAERVAPKCSPKSSQTHRASFWAALGALLLFQTRRNNSLCDFIFSLDLLQFSRLRRSFLRVFSISVFRFLPILYRGLGTIFVIVERLWCCSGCLSRSSQALLASFIPVWLLQEGLKRRSFLTRRTLTRHAQACTDRTSRPTPISTETGPTS